MAIHQTIRTCERCGAGFPVPTKRPAQRFCNRHCANKRESPADRFWPRVNKNGPVPESRPDLGSCWIYSGRINDKGYGIFVLDEVDVRAHRWSYEQLVGPIPEGLDLDHLCRVRECVRPEHLEPVTTKVNVLRGEGITARHARKETCAKGHALTPRPGGGRICRECHRSYTR